MHTLETGLVRPSDVDGPRARGKGNTHAALSWSLLQAVFVELGSSAMFSESNTGD